MDSDMAEARADAEVSANPYKYRIQKRPRENSSEDLLDDDEKKLDVEVRALARNLVLSMVMAMAMLCTHTHTLKDGVLEAYAAPVGRPPLNYFAAPAGGKTARPCARHTAPNRTEPTAPHRTAPHRTAPHRTPPSPPGIRTRNSPGTKRDNYARATGMQAMRPPGLIYILTS